ncbi:CaiB/BaiF CoA transferase family protein [Phascolarctobacterium sp.]
MGALSGVKILELGQVVAAPFCGALLGDFGAEVTKVESITGDGLRNMGPQYDGRSLWFNVENRNKKVISVNLKDDEGKAILKKMIAEADVMIENFRPGILEKLGFDIETIRSINPSIIVTRLSGYGQTGPYRKRAGYDRVGVGMGGLTYITGFQDRPPLKPGVSVADYLVGFSAAYGIMLALYERDIKGSGKGQEIDIALFEPIFRILEFTALNYHLTGTVRERTGNTFVATVPSGHFQSKDGKWISIALANDKLFTKLAQLIGREDWLEREEFKTQVQRQENRTEIDQYTEQWINEHSAKECFDILGDFIPMGPIYDIASIFEDPHYKARGDIIEVSDERWGKVKMQGIVPKLSRTPGSVNWLGPDLGENSLEILQELGYKAMEIERLKQSGVVKFKESKR